MDWEQRTFTRLRKAESGRWMLNDIELSSGDCFQIWLDGQWINVRVEHDGRRYYASPAAVRLYPGLHARFPSQWGD